MCCATGSTSLSINTVLFIYKNLSTVEFVIYIYSTSFPFYVH